MSSIVAQDLLYITTVILFAMLIVAGCMSLFEATLRALFFRRR